VIILVAPHVGAWIEIATIIHDLLFNVVAPHVGAWIEMLIAIKLTKSLLPSHLT